MQDYSNSLQQIVAIGVIALWAVFAIGFFILKRKSGTETKQRDPRALIGLVFQILGMGLVWGVRRPLTSTSIQFPAQLGLAVAAFSIMLISVIAALYAVRVLGKQWAIGAQVSNDHRLIVRGPYSIIRNPIYSGLMGMMVATSLSISEFYIILPALVLYVIGFVIRIRSEEKLLRKTFGAEYEEYCKRVPAIFPRFFASHYQSK
jgi:protein-S-isoprenylcysteine O-methyltransferase Ste14